MTRFFECFIEGKAQPKQRPRFASNGKRVFTPAETRRYENKVAMTASEAMGGAEPITGPVKLEMRFHMRKPKTKKKEGWHASRPDLDNLQKSVKDGLTKGGWFLDDSQVAVVYAEKKYSDKEGVQVSVHALTEHFQF